VRESRFPDILIDQQLGIPTDCFSVLGEQADNLSEKATSGTNTETFGVALFENRPDRDDGVLADADNQTSSVLANPVEDQFGDQVKSSRDTTH
jgi:hypothetical protein